MKVVKALLLVLAGLFIAIQFVPSGIPENKPESDRSLAASGLSPDNVLAQLRKSCFDCHSDQVSFPWYARIAPSSWLLARHINEGREHLNFSSWEDYSVREKNRMLNDIADEVKSGNMPLKSYLLLHRDARLDSAKMNSIVSWTEEASEKIME